MFENLDSRDWSKYVPDIAAAIKSEFQGTKGYIKKLKSITHVRRKSLILDAENKVISGGVKNLDKRIDKYLSEIEMINNQAVIEVQYDIINIIQNDNDLDGFNLVRDIKRYLSLTDPANNSYERLTSIIYKVVNQSLGQGNKANAGMAGESFVRAILGSAGLRKGIDFREQYKSDKGSDTDFVIPCIEDYNDGQLVVLIAVQISTNDRARLTSSELKSGALSYLITGNGCKASTKRLSDIGNQIIESYKSDNVKIVCLKSELERERSSLQARIDSGEKDHVIINRLAYFNNYAINFEEFANKIKIYKQS